MIYKCQQSTGHGNRVQNYRLPSGSAVRGRDGTTLRIDSCRARVEPQMSRKCDDALLLWAAALTKS